MKRGDKVHVEFNGVVQPDGAHNDQWCTVLIDDSNDGNVVVRRSSCRVIVPPIAVGDVVTAENIEQLPSRSVVAFTAAVYIKFGKNWHGGSLELSNTGLLECYETPVVLRIGGGDQ